MGTRFDHRLVNWVLGALIFCAASLANATDLAPLRAYFQLPHNHIEYAAVKLTVDTLIDPSTDAAAVRRELDVWERAMRDNIPADPTERQILDAILKTLYEPGPWNQGQPFSYDFSDPSGRNPKNKRLDTYLATRKGNCVSMPILVAILGQRLGLTIALATAPNHMLLKFADDNLQVWLNVEATAGGFKSDSSYERDFFGITPLAIQNELYLRPLLPREGVGVIASTLMEHFSARKDGDALMEVADMVLAVNPKDSVAMIWKANAYNLQLQERYVSRYSKLSDIPAEKLADYHRLSRENFAWFDKAEALGWTQPTPEQEANYIQHIQREKARRGQ